MTLRHLKTVNVDQFKIHQSPWLQIIIMSPGKIKHIGGRLIRTFCILLVFLCVTEEVAILPQAHEHDSLFFMPALPDFSSPFVLFSPYSSSLFPSIIPPSLPSSSHPTTVKTFPHQIQRSWGLRTQLKDSSQQSLSWHLGSPRLSLATPGKANLQARRLKAELVWLVGMTGVIHTEAVWALA